MVKIIIILMVSVFCFSCRKQAAYQDSNLSVDERAKSLLSQLTLEEKVGVMSSQSRAVERLGIPVYNWQNDASHGVAYAGKATVFPQAIGLAATFDEQAVYETFSIVSDEARAKYHNFKQKEQLSHYLGLTFLVPSINIFRDPRWGKGMETLGEDPYLTSKMGISAVKGMQGDGSEKYDKTHACVKHFAVHSGPEWSSHSFDAKNISDRNLYETYLPAFKAIVQEAGIKEVMCANNRLEGEPCCANKELLTDILRNDWKFDGVVISDCDAISDFYAKDGHKTHTGQEEAAVDAVAAGTDLECGVNYKSLAKAIRLGMLTENQLDESLFRLLRARFELGLFDDDSQVSWTNIPISVVGSEKHKAKALEMAQKSIVLLNNKNNILPLSKNIRKLAVVGPGANDSIMLWANHNGFPTKTVTILKGIQNKLSQRDIIYEKGCDYVEITPEFHSLFYECVFNGEKGFSARFWNSADFTGNEIATGLVTQPFNYDTNDETLFAPGINLRQFSAHFKSVFIPTQSREVIFKISGDDGYSLKINGKNVAEHWGVHPLTSREYILKAEKGLKYEIDISYLQKGGSGTLSFDFGFLRDVNYEPVFQKVKDADAIIFVGGISSALEGGVTDKKYPGFNKGDRTAIELPASQIKMLQLMKKTGKPVIFVLCSGSAMAMPWVSEHVDAILAAWYPGQEGGTAVADVLFGDYNPAGRLPVTFYASTGDLPDFEDYTMANRTYRYFKGTPLYPFGYGLSYTRFEYGNANLSKTEINKDETLTLNFSLKNTGSRDGDEVVQVYVRNPQDPESPIKSLKAFKRITIGAGTTEDVKIDLPPSSFEFFDAEKKKMEIKPGKYEILYGGSSADRALKSLLVLVK